MADAIAGLNELTTLVRDCSISGVPRRVLLVRIELLPERLTRPHHLRLAYEALDPLSDADRARRFELSHGRIAIAWRGEAADRLNRVLDHLAHLLGDAPMEAPSMPELARLFDLPRDGAALLAVASSPDGNAATAATATAVHVPAMSATVPLDLQTLETVEARLATANVARFARRRLVCRLEHGGALTTAWENRHLAIDELTAELCPGRDIFADPWLFRRLTRTLDRRMLALLCSASELRDAGPFGLDLNVGGILSPEFIRFDAAIPARLRGQAVLNLHPADVMGDLPGFRFACAFARGRGYRILLRSISPPMLPILDLAALELDFVELRWSSTLLGFDPAGLRAGSARWLLARADTPDALRWGRAVGIGLFGGDAARTGTALAAAGLDRPRSAA